MNSSWRKELTCNSLLNVRAAIVRWEWPWVCLGQYYLHRLVRPSRVSDRSLFQSCLEMPLIKLGTFCKDMLAPSCSASPPPHLTTSDPQTHFQTTWGNQIDPDSHCRLLLTASIGLPDFACLTQICLISLIRLCHPQHAFVDLAVAWAHTSVQAGHSVWTTNPFSNSRLLCTTAKARFPSVLMRSFF